MDTNLQGLELSIFCLASVVEYVEGPCLGALGSVLSRVVRSGGAKQPYVWMQLLKLVGKLGTEALCSK